MVDLGTHLGSKEQANERLKDNYRNTYGIGAYAGGDQVLKGSNIIPAKVRLGKSLEMPDVGTWNNSESVIEKMNEMPEFEGLFDEALDDVGGSRFYDDIDDWIESPENRELLDEIRDTIKSKGYDSIKYKNLVENKYGSSGDPIYSPKDKKDLEQKRKELSKIQEDYESTWVQKPMPTEEEAVRNPNAVQDWLDNGAVKPEMPLPMQERKKALEDDIYDIKKRDLFDPSSYISLDPSNIRSTNAAFNPKNIGSSNILGQATVPGMIGGTGLGLAGLLAMEGEPLNTDLIQGASTQGILGALSPIADAIEFADENISGPASMMIPTGTSEYIRKLQYGDDIGYLDRLFANPLL
jgi:uncharacterized protein (UPF0297 family)